MRSAFTAGVEAREEMDIGGEGGLFGSGRVKRVGGEGRV